MDKHLFGIDDPKVRLSVLQLAVKRVYGWTWLFVIIVSCGVLGAAIHVLCGNQVPVWADLVVCATCGAMCAFLVNLCLTRKASAHLPEILKSQLRCENCGYQLIANGKGRCPECGSSQDQHIELKDRNSWSPCDAIVAALLDMKKRGIKAAHISEENMVNYLCPLSNCSYELPHPGVAFPMLLTWARQSTVENPIVVQYSSADDRLVGHVFAESDTVRVVLINNRQSHGPNYRKRYG